MKNFTLAVVLLSLSIARDTAAHQLDEYLQATRLALGHNHIQLEIDLTPGAAIAPIVLARLDRDGDNTISPAEAATYGRLVLGDLILKFDDRSIVTNLTHVEVAPIDALRDGVGVIQIRAIGGVVTDVRRRHHIYFRNNHEPGISVYLVNALAPDDGNVRVVAQTRNSSQQQARIDYDIGARWPAQVLWFVFGTGGLLMLAMVRPRRRRLS
jgi:hypothetical protein